MSNYAVKSGDNLWNICKRAFNLKNNTEIAKKVKEVANANNLKKPQLIFPGQEINMDMGLTVEKTKPSESEPVSNPVVQQKNEYSPEILKAVDSKIKSKDIKSVEDLETAGNSSVSIFGSSVVSKEDKEKAYKDYSKKLLDEYYDADHDGVVTAGEFEEREAATQDEISGLKNDRTEKEIKKDKVIAQRQANLFAQNLDMNQDGIISPEEFAFFQKMSDGLDGKEDGVIAAKKEAVMFNTVTGQTQTRSFKNELLERYYNNEELSESDLNQAVISKYVEGCAMTDKEMEILKNAGIKIRKGMSKAAGFDQ